MSELLAEQAKVKYLNSARDGKYKLVSKTKEGREAEWQRQQDKLHSLHSITERLEGEFPSQSGQLRNLSLSLKSRLVESQLLPSRELQVA